MKTLVEYIKEACEDGKCPSSKTLSFNFADCEGTEDLLKSVKDWTELSSIDLAPITKSFEINNPELQQKLKEFLEKDEEVVAERNRLIEAQ